MLKRTHHPHRPRTDAAVQLAEIDTGIRQCLQVLMSCEAMREQESQLARDYWLRLAERAWRDFDEDRQLVNGGSTGSSALDLA